MGISKVRERKDIEKVLVDRAFGDKNITEDEILKLLKELNQNKSAGPDELHPKSLHELRHSLVQPLAIIFNA